MHACQWCMCACLSAPQQASGGQRTTWENSLLSTCGSWELNSGHQAWAGLRQLTSLETQFIQVSITMCHYLITSVPSDNRDPNLSALLAKPTLARLPLHGCRLPPHCRCTHTLSPLQRRPRILFPSRPQPPAWVGRPQLGMSMCTARPWSCTSEERDPWAGRLGDRRAEAAPIPTAPH